MAEPSNQQILDETQVIDRQVSKLSTSVLTTSTFKDRMAVLDKSITDLKPKEESPKLDKALSDFVGLTGVVTSIKDLVKGLSGGSGWEKTAVMVGGVTAGLALLGVKIFDFGKLIQTLVAKITTDGATPNGKRFTTNQHGLPTLEAIPKDPLEEIRKAVEKINPKIATLSRGIRLATTKTGELRSDVSSLNSGISGLTGHMTTFSSRMSEMTQQVRHLNDALT